MAQYLRDLTVDKDLSNYCEPFFGSGAFFINNLDRIEQATINDLDWELMLLYQDVKDNLESLVVELEVLYSRMQNAQDQKAEYYEVRQEYCIDFGNYTQQQLSARLFVMTKVAFNGMKKFYNKCNNRYSTPPGVIGKNAYKEVPYGHLEFWSQALQRCTIVSKPFEQIDYDPFTFIYFDPPYRESSVNYEKAFPDKLLTFAVNVLKYKEGMLSNWLDDVEFWNTFGLPIHEYNLSHTAGRGTAKKKVTEIVITSWR